MTTGTIWWHNGFNGYSAQSVPVETIRLKMLKYSQFQVKLNDSEDIANHSNAPYIDIKRRNAHFYDAVLIH